MLSYRLINLLYECGFSMDTSSEHLTRFKYASGSISNYTKIELIPDIQDTSLCGEPTEYISVTIERFMDNGYLDCYIDSKSSFYIRSSSLIEFLDGHHLLPTHSKGKSK